MDDLHINIITRYVQRWVVNGGMTLYLYYPACLSALAGYLLYHLFVCTVDPAHMPMMAQNNVHLLQPAAMMPGANTSMMHTPVVRTTKSNHQQGNTSLFKNNVSLQTRLSKNKNYS